MGWFSSPACSLIYQVSKYVALFSSKGYAIGEAFAEWLGHKLQTTPAVAQQLIGHVEDLLAICGGRSYVFFIDASVVERFAQFESLYGYLLEEKDLAKVAGGKLRSAILTGFESAYVMAAVRSMALIAESWVWPTLIAVKPGPEMHILDVLPVIWPRSLAWLEEAALHPEQVIDGSMNLRLSLEAGGQRVQKPTLPSEATRGGRAAMDMVRIRATLASDSESHTLVCEMLRAAFSAMALGLRNHAAEFVAGGRCCTANITAELRQQMDGVPTTSTSVETLFASVKRRATRQGASRHDTRMGSVMCDRDHTVAWARLKPAVKQELAWDLARKRRRAAYVTTAAARAAAGTLKDAPRQAKLAQKRGGRAKKAANLERIKTVELLSKYSALKKLDNPGLADQLKVRAPVLPPAPLRHAPPSPSPSHPLPLNACRCTNLYMT